MQIYKIHKKERFLKRKENNIISAEIPRQALWVCLGPHRGGWNEPTEYVVSHALFWCFGDARFARLYYWGKKI